VPVVDAVATYDETAGAASVFLVNRSLTEEVTIEIDASRLGMSELSAQTLHDDDIHARNTVDDPDRVVPAPNTTARVHDGIVSITLPAVSWTAVSLS